MNEIEQSERDQPGLRALWKLRKVDPEAARELLQLPLINELAHAFSDIDAGTRAVGTVIREHPVASLVLASSVSVGLSAKLPTEIALHQHGGVLQFLTRMDTWISQMPHGTDVLAYLKEISLNPTPFNFNRWMGDDQPALVNYGLWVSSLGSVLGVGGLLTSVPAEFTRRFFRGKRIQEGIEPLRKTEYPRFLLIGPLQLMDAVSAILPDRDPHLPGLMRGVDVFIHAEPGQPESLGKLEYHFDISKFISGIPTETSLADWISQQKNKVKLPFMQNGVMVAFDTDNALFYADNASAALPVSLFASMLGMLVAGEGEKAHAKSILILAPRGATHIVGVADELDMIDTGTKKTVLTFMKDLKKQGTHVEVRSPEDIVWDRKISNDLRDIPNPVVTVVGDINDDAIQRFAEYIRSKRADAEVHVVTDVQLDGHHKDSYVNDTKSRDDALREIYSKSNKIYVYADKDPKTTSVAAQILQNFSVNASDVCCMIERSSFMNDTNAKPAQYYCIYDEISAYIETWMKEQLTKGLSPAS